MAAASMASEDCAGDLFDDDLVVDEGNGVIQPYMYEPVVESARDNSDSCSESGEGDDGEMEDERLDRIGNINWCHCGVCTPQEKGRESLCCSDYSPVQTKKDELKVECITQHPGFSSTCLDRWVLEMSMYHYIEEQGQIGDDQPIHKLYRYVAYRNLVRWVWKRLGRRNCLPLPVCARDKIRAAWPAPDNDGYTGFKYPTFN
ncbi:P2X purinoceptor 7-like [Lineus longissimus]|uniref:P2X purinoceptor 7-like n=1 Tax=Lineus longissimus TaxID=88925 RepID=UPI00315CF5C7